MKIQFLIVSAMIFALSCNTKPQPQSNDGKNTTDSMYLAADTAGLAEFRAIKAQNELGTKNSENQTEERSSPKTATGKTSRSANSSAPAGTAANNSHNTAASSGSSGTSAEKKGWSKTAKGAVVGGVVGAGTGAVVNKKNRVAGAVIGGAI
jgi:hypothetical protein